MLLKELSAANAGAGTQDFRVFRQTRDFEKLPDSLPLTTTSRFFGQLSILYSIVFHVLGGEARVTAVKEGSADVVYIRSCVRTLFLHSKQFEQELEKATATLPTVTAAYQAKTYIRKLRNRIFDAETGTIQLDLSLEDPRSLGTRKPFALQMPF